MQAAILIGGIGSRLGSLVQDTPKPLLEVCDRPFVEHLMINLKRFGFTDFVLLAGYKADVVNEFFGPGSDFSAELKARITVLVEPEPLGTAGALKFAKDILEDEFLLLNGDSVFDFNYLDLAVCRSPDETDRWLGRVALLPVADTARYGRVELDGNIITAFREKTGEAKPGIINSGIYWLKKEVLDLITTAPCSLEGDIFPSLVAASQLVGQVYEGFFIDIGIPEDLEHARANLIEDLRKPAVYLDRDGTLNHDSGYTHKIEDFKWVDGAKDAIKRANDQGYLVFIVTNQAGIARGFYDEDAVVKLHRWIDQDLAKMGAHIDDMRFCPHHPEGSVEGLTKECTWRKPGTGMLESLQTEWNPLPEGSFMLGDMDKDVEAGAAIGIAAEKIPTGDILPAMVRHLSR